VKICEVDEFAKLAKFAFSVSGLERGRRPRRGDVADSRNHHPLTTALLNTTPPPNPSSTPPCTATTLVTSAGDDVTAAAATMTSARDDVTAAAAKMTSAGDDATAAATMTSAGDDVTAAAATMTSAGDVRDNGSGPFSSEAAGMAAYRASGVAAARVWNCLPPQSCLSVELAHGVGLGRDFQFLVGLVGSIIAKSTKKLKGLC